MDAALWEDGSLVVLLDGLDPGVPDWEDTGGDNAADHDTEQQNGANTQDRGLPDDILTEDIIGNLQIVPYYITVAGHQ